MIDENKLANKQIKDNQHLFFRINNDGQYSSDELKQLVKDYQKLEKLFKLFLKNFEEIFDKIATENVFRDMMETDNHIFDIQIKKHEKNLKQFILNEYLKVNNTQQQKQHRKYGKVKK